MRPKQQKKSLSRWWRNQKGTFLVLAAAFSVPLIGTGILASDLGMAYLVRTEMLNASDLSSLAAIKRFSNVTGPLDDSQLNSIRRAARVTAELNSTRLHNKIHIDTSPVTGDDPQRGVVLGFYDADTETFTGHRDSDVLSGKEHVNAIKTRIALGEGENDPFIFQLAHILNKDNSGWSQIILVSESVASYGLMNIALLFDISASMSNRTYRIRPECHNNVYHTQSSRWFHYSARPNESAQECAAGSMHAGEPVFGPVHSGHDVVMPEPATGVFKATKDVLLETQLFRGLYRSGLIVYESRAYLPYAPDGEAIKLTADNPFNKDSIAKAISFSIDRWEDYAKSGPYDNLSELNNLATQYPNLAFVGGLDPPDSTFTNIGDAILLAVEWISEANQETHTEVANRIVLFSDGIPNCYRDPIHDPKSADFSEDPKCPNTQKIRTKTMAKLAEMEDEDPDFDREGAMIFWRDFYTQEYYEKGMEWSRNNAKFAGENNIAIDAVYFAVEEVCAPDAKGFQHLQNVVSVNGMGGQAFCADEVEELAQIYEEELAMTQTFVWVKPKHFDAA